MARIPGEVSAEFVFGLLLPDRHTLLMRQRRAQLMVSRVRFIAAMFAILTPLWILIDLAFFSWPLWGILAVLRLMASAAFASIAIRFHSTEDIGRALRALTLLQLVPTAFFIAAVQVINAYPETGMGETAAAGYQFLPYVMVALLAVFPITLFEGILFSIPPLFGTLSGMLGGASILPFNTVIGAIWLLLLITVVATVAGMSQLHFMSALVNQSARDLLTRAYTRRVGEELLDLLFSAAARTDRPITVAFFDLDDFKSVNDRYGHEEGDRTLRKAAEALRLVLRRNDILVRWGGEEFLVIMPFTDCDGARIAMARLHTIGLGERPDGRVQTASVGMAERSIDRTTSWQALVERADRRMYAAKQTGKNKIVLCDETVMAVAILDPGGNHAPASSTKPIARLHS